MRPDKILINEKYGTTEKQHIIISLDKNKIEIEECKPTLTNTIYGNFCSFWRAVLLPTGWPDSVSEDYLTYQIWDSTQAACSGVTGALATRAILAGVGVGNASATPLAAAISWILKDGTGLIGRILFAWWKGTGLDADCKKWRLFADFLNDGALCIELTLPYVIHYSTYLLCFSTTMKAIVGVAGGATRASIIQHQALRNNIGDVAAKDASQETCVNLLASIFALLLLMIFSEGQYDWPLFITFTLLHLLSNYFAVKSLKMSSLNECRFLIILKDYLQHNIINSLKDVNNRESVFLGYGVKASNLCNFEIKLGCSLKSIMPHVHVTQLTEVIKIYQNCKYILIPDIHNKSIYVIFAYHETYLDIIEAYFNAIYLAFALSYHYNIQWKVLPEEIKYEKSPLIELYNLLEQSVNQSNKLEHLIDLYKKIKLFSEQHFMKFHKALLNSGWRMDNQLFPIDEWRAEWNEDYKGLYAMKRELVEDKKLL